MRNMTMVRRFGATLMALVMMLSLAVSAFAISDPEVYCDNGTGGRMHTDVEPYDGTCDYCGYAVCHVDEDEDGNCDICGKVFVDRDTVRDEPEREDPPVEPDWSRPEFTDAYKAALMTSKTLKINNAIKDASYTIYPVLIVKDIQENDDELLFLYSTEGKNVDVMNEILASLAAQDIAASSQNAATNGRFGYAGAPEVDVADGVKVKAGLAVDDKTNYVGFMVKVVAGNMDVQAAYAEWAKSAAGTMYSMNFASALKDAVYRAETAGDYQRDGAMKEKAKGSVVEFKDIPVGYYLVTSTAGKNIMSFTLPGSEDKWEINEKNKAPDLEKTLTEPSLKADKTVNDASIGDEIIYHVVLDVGTGLDRMTFVDTLSKGLTFGSLKNIRFFPRNADGSVADVNEYTGYVNTDKDGKLLYKDADGKTVTVENPRDVLLDSKTFDGGKAYGKVDAEGNRDAKKDGYVSWLGDTNRDMFNEKHEASNEKWSANVKAADDGTTVLKITFEPEWLASKRLAEGWAATSNDPRAYTADPISTGDTRLNEDTPRKNAESGVTAEMYNQYIGAVENPLDDGGLIWIEYTAYVNDKAEIGPAGNPNEAYIEYSHDPNPDPDPKNPEPPIETPKHKTYTYVYELDVLKYAQGNEATGLAGASFQVYRAVRGDNGEGLEVYTRDTLPSGASDKNYPIFAAGTEGVAAKVTVSDSTITALNALADNEQNAFWFEQVEVNGVTAYRVLTKTQSEGLAELRKAGNTEAIAEKHYTNTVVSGVDGKINIVGLDSGLYALKETEAPNGYILADEPIYVVIGGVSSGSATVTDNVVDPGTYVQVSHEDKTYTFQLADGIEGSTLEQVKIANASGLRMPETGGIGTTIFYVSGAVLALGAVVLLVVKKRVGDRDA